MVAHTHYNEWLDSNGNIRPHWQTFMHDLGLQTDEQMQKRLAAIQRQIHDNGVTYNVYADTQGLQRPWSLDSIPFILSHDEWQEISAAVAQRAFLLNKILLDIYGPQKLIADGQLPPGLIYGHSGFLHACHGTTYDDNIALHLYAVDLVRAPDGRWWVIGDRTQAPTGAGYALENRMVLSSIYPDLFRELNVERLSDFFTTMSTSMTHWARLCAARQSAYNADIAPLQPNEAPLIVILTPGPYNETYHEQSYLAGYLGYPLVQGGDLTMRNGVVWLKTLLGLKPVHGIVRRQDDDFCDPLEFNEHSLLGIPGLNEAVRLGTVFMANALGSNILQSGALLGYLPALSHHLLGEELRIPSVATWWCGEAAAMQHVLQHMDRLIVKPAFPQIPHEPVFGADLDEAARAALAEKINANPENYIAQELIRLSQSPVFDENTAATEGLTFAKLPASAIGVRVYACATPNGYTIMPGGLTRVGSSGDSRVLSMQQGGTSKDTWVTASYANPYVSLLKTHVTAQDLIRDNAYVPSRMVEDLFWYGRHAMRGKYIARLLRTAVHTFLYHSPEARTPVWPTLQIVAYWYHLLPAYNPGEPLGDQAIEQHLIHAVFTADSTSLYANINQLYQLAFRLREYFSNDHWRMLNQLLHQFQVASSKPDISDTLDYLNDANTAFVTMMGFTMDGMTRNLSWQFIQAGLYLERLQFLSVLLQQTLYMPEQNSLDWLLDLADSGVTYRSRYDALPEYLPVLDLLVLDPSNPQSVMFQLQALSQCLQAIPDNLGAQLTKPLHAQIQALHAMNIDADFVHQSNRLNNWLSEMQTICTDLSAALSAQFFTHTPE